MEELLVGPMKNPLIISSGDGVDASTKCARQKFDLLVTDTKLPKINGLKLLDFIAQLPLAVRPKDVLVLSDELKEDYFKENYPSVFFLEKPCANDAINDVISKVVAKQSAQNESAAPRVEFIGPFVDGTVVVMKTLASTEITKEKLFLRSNDQISGDISAVIAMNCSRFRGSFAIAFSKATFLKVMQKMLGETFEEVTAEISDGAGEICNQIFGYAKTELNKKGFDLTPALPSVVFGDNHRIKHFCPGPVIAVQFATADGPFTIETSVALVR